MKAFPSIPLFAALVLTACTTSHTVRTTNDINDPKPSITEDTFFIPPPSEGDWMGSFEGRSDKLKALEGVYECDYDYMVKTGPGEFTESAYGPASIYACVHGRWGTDTFVIIRMRNAEFHEGVTTDGFRRLKAKGASLVNLAGRKVATFRDFDATSKKYQTMMLGDELFRRVPTKK